MNRRPRGEADVFEEAQEMSLPHYSNRYRRRRRRKPRYYWIPEPEPEPEADHESWRSP